MSTSEQYALYTRDGKELRPWRFPTTQAAISAAMMADVRDPDRPWVPIAVRPVQL